jgi:hypothetical protein
MSHFGYWHETDMPKQLSHVCCGGRNGPSSGAPRGLSLIRSGLHPEPLMAAIAA